MDPIPDNLFTPYTVLLPGGPVIYELHHRSISLLGGTFWMRQVIRKQGAHQTVIVTTDQDLPIEEVARRMFGRWGQENFFKYMRQEFALDALVQYGTEPDDPARLAPNPARKTLERQIVLARQQVRPARRQGAAVKLLFAASARRPAPPAWCGMVLKAGMLRLCTCRARLIRWKI